MKKFIIYSVVFVALILLFNPVNIFAQTDYVLLQSIPLEESGCTGSEETCRTNASNYISGVFTLLIGVAGVLAVVMIIVGGIKYMSTDAFSGKSEAKDTIQNAIGGLLLALGAWVILNTISPNLVNFNITIQRLEQAPPITTGGIGGTIPGYSLTPAQVTRDTQLRRQLLLYNPPIRVNQPTACVNGETSGCTNIVGLSNAALSGVMALASTCQQARNIDCEVVISGGTEGGHQTHGPNPPLNSNVDLRLSPELSRHIMSTGQPTTASCGMRGTAKWIINGVIYNDEGNHWHVCY